MHLFRRFVLALLIAFAPVLARAEGAVELLMAEEHGCAWCERWNTDIAHIYPKTEEGKTAPLRRVDISDPLPEGIVLSSRLRFTPTFVLLRDGAEVDRIEGYPGEDFFWMLLGMMLKNAGLMQTTG